MDLSCESCGKINLPSTIDSRSHAAAVFQGRHLVHTLLLCGTKQGHDGRNANLRFFSALGSRSLPLIMARQGSSSAPSLLPPRVFPSTGFDLIDRSEKVEEERLPSYNRDDYYPMRIGEVVNKHYQVVAKLGYGTSSTVWLCRDLRYAFSSCFENAVCMSFCVDGGVTLTCKRREILGA